MYFIEYEYKKRSDEQKYHFSQKLANGKNCELLQ